LGGRNQPLPQALNRLTHIAFAKEMRAGHEDIRTRTGTFTTGDVVDAAILLEIIVIVRQNTI
jgi:hypothetical protein